MQCLMPQQIWSRDQEVFKTLQNIPIPPVAVKQIRVDIVYDEFRNRW